MAIVGRKKPKGLGVNHRTALHTEEIRRDQEWNALAERVRELSGRLQSVREQERTRIAREIHDDLGQRLTALKIDLGMLGRKLSAGTPVDTPALLKQVAAMSGLIDSSIVAVRHIATDLRPQVLDDMGFSEAICQRVRDFELRTGIECAIESAVATQTLDEAYSTTLFRILGEALTNVARHAGATEVSIAIQEQDDRIVLKIRDNGKGIAASEIAAQDSLGLMSMRERVDALGGQLTVEGVPGEATIVTVTLFF